VLAGGLGGGLIAISGTLRPDTAVTDPVLDLSIFSGPSERFPAQLAARVRENAGPALASALQLANAQYSSSPDGGLWLVRAGGQICLIQASRGALECRSAKFVSRHGLALGVFNVPRNGGEQPRTYVMLGAAPNWARWANIRVGATIRSVAIRENTFSAHARRPLWLDGFSS
jgi:hypothetical protein